MTPGTPLRGLPLTVIDVETTGLSFDADHIVEIAVAHGTLGAACAPALLAVWGTP